MSEVIKPYQLKKGASVALVNPVSTTPNRYRDDANILQWLQQSVQLNAQSYVSAEDTPQQRVGGFNQAITDNMQALFPQTGNKYGDDVVDSIEYESMKLYKPIFVTFSAASVLLHAIWERAGVVTFYGTHIPFLYDGSKNRENSYTQNSFWNMLCQEGNLLGVDEIVAPYIFRWVKDRLTLHNLFSSGLNPKEIKSEPFHFVAEKFHQTSPAIRGRLLPSLTSSLLAAHDIGIQIDYNGKIVLVEAEDVSFTNCINILTELKRRTNIGDAAALVLASFTTRKGISNHSELEEELYDKEEVLAFVESVRRLLDDNIPVIFGFPMGHGRYKLTVPYGIEANLNLENGDIDLNESPFSEGL